MTILWIDWDNQVGLNIRQFVVGNKNISVQYRLFPNQAWKNYFAYVLQGNICLLRYWLVWVRSTIFPKHLEYGLTLQWRHNERDGVSNHQPHDFLLNHLFRHRWKNTWKLRVTGLCAGNSPGTDEFPAQRAVTRKMFPFDDVIMIINFPGLLPSGFGTAHT